MTRGQVSCAFRVVVPAPNLSFSGKGEPKRRPGTAPTLRRSSETLAASFLGRRLRLSRPSVPAS